MSPKATNVEDVRAFSAPSGRPLGAVPGWLRPVAFAAVFGLHGLPFLGLTGYGGCDCAADVS